MEKSSELLFSVMCISMCCTDCISFPISTISSNILLNVHMYMLFSGRELLSFPMFMSMRYTDCISFPFPSSLQTYHSMCICTCYSQRVSCCLFSCMFISMCCTDCISFPLSTISSNLPLNVHVYICYSQGVSCCLFPCL